MPINLSAQNLKPNPEGNSNPENQRGGMIQTYTLVGILLGCTIAVGGWILDILMRELDWSLGAIAQVHATNPLHWILDLNPLFFGCMGWTLGQVKIAQKTTDPSPLLLSPGTGNGFGIPSLGTPTADQLALYLNHLPVAVIELNLNGEIQTWNSTAEMLFGYHSSEAIANPLLTLIIPENARPDSQNHWNQFLTHPSKQRWQLENCTQDGRTLTCEWNILPLLNPSSELIGVAALVCEITQQVQTETALRDSEARLRRLSEATFEGIIIHIRGKIIDVNQALVKMIGYSEEELIGNNAFNFLTPNSKQIALEMITLGDETPYEVELLKKDGTILVVEIQGKDILNSREGVRVAAVRDISDRKRSQDLEKLLIATVTENQRTLATLMSNLPGMVYRCKNERDWTMEFVSDGCVALTGYNPEDIIRNRRISFSQIIHPDDQEKLWKKVQSCLQNQQPFECAYRIITRTGETKWIWEQGRGIFSVTGELFALEGYLSDITERTKSVEALRQSEARYRTISELASDFVYSMTFNEEGEPIAEWVTDSFKRITGYTREEINQKGGWHQVIHPEDLPKFRQFEREMLGENGAVLEYRIFTKAGEICWLRDSARTVGHEGEELRKQVLGSVQDVSDRKRSEFQMLHAMSLLSKSEAKNRALLNAMPDLMFRFDRKQTILDFKPVKGIDFGNLTGQFLGKKLSDLLSEEVVANCLKALEKTLATHEIEIFEYDLKINEEVYSYESRVVASGDKEALAIVRDITARKRSEAEKLQLIASLQESEEKYRSVVNTVQEVIFQTDSNGCWTFLNPAWTEISGYSIEESLGTPFINYINPDDHPEIQQRFQKLVQGQTDYCRHEVCYLTKTGDRRWMDVYARLRLSADGTMIGLGGTLNDISDRKKVSQQLQEAKAAAEAANRAKSAFLANMSHELRTPLNAIIGYSEILLEESEDLGSEELIPDLQKIQVAGRHLLALINDILDISKIEAGKMELYLETFEIQTLLDNVIATAKPLIAKNNNTLESICPPDIGTLYADLTKIRQVLLNLLSNAAKFTIQGTITFEVSRDLMWIPQTPLNSSLGESGDPMPMDSPPPVNGDPLGSPSPCIIFRVTDTGIGMSLEQMNQIFNAFTQADPSTTRKYGGTGLGLAISQRFCEMMGGEISVSSQVGVGSTFTVRVPTGTVTPLP
ncbi:PAS domain-containing sensor histidine kinase [Oscillatoria acuminata]|uniref:histidine kinase n=1 Tax=Oscillatoria acuminata PCC 6304 TaxID=56110 RepID=K9TIH1_9CYAN|nr:PAS domain S-box protein [Oscillatoria acuminata]AFY81804.1 PAS domain S-box [Oscillatoria acuminata PCC 6304]